MKIFSKYLIKRSFLISIFIFIIFAILDTVFNFISELENLSLDYTFLYALKHALTSMPHRSIEFLEGACLLGFMVALGISHQEGNLNVLRSNGLSPIKIILISSLGSMIVVLSILAMDEIAFREMHINSKVEKDYLLDQATQEQSQVQWIKQNDYLLSYTNVIDDLILNPRLIKVDSNIDKVKYFKSSKSAKIEENGITFDQSLMVEGNPSSDEISNYEIFSFPLVASIPFSDIDSLSFNRISSYRSLMNESSLDEDILFRAHLDKFFYKKIFYPFSVLAIMIFFGSFIFGSLRDSTPGSRIVFAVFGGFLYRIFQDLSISISISYNTPVLIGVIAPAIILLILSFFFYRKI